VQSETTDGQALPFDRLFRPGLTDGLGFPRPPLLVLWLIGLAIMSVATAISFRSGLTTSSVGFIYLAVIALLSVMDSLASSLVFSILAVALLDYFFIEPIFTFQIDFDADVSTLIAFVVTSFAVTGLVRRVRTLGEAQREQARLLDLTHDAIFVRGLDHVISFWNRGAEIAYGWTREEAVGRVSHDLLKTVYPGGLDGVMDTVLNTGRWEGEMSRTRKDGAGIVTATRWSLEKNPRGQPVGLLEISTDITERKRAQEALERIQAAYLAEAQSLSHTGSFAWVADEGDIVWSEECARIYEFEPTAKPTVETLMEMIHPDDLARVQQTYQRMLEDGDRIDTEHRLLMADGSIKHVHVVAHVMSQNGHGRQFVGALMDVTETKQAREQLEQAQANLAHVARVTTLGQLTASIGHEVNQPLAAIVTNGDAALRFLRRDPPDLDEVRDALTGMIAEGKRASEIVKRIRSMVQKTTPAAVPVDINALLSDCASLIQREIASNRVVLQLEFTPGLPPILGDAVQLQQVVINLMVNAIQAMADVEDRMRKLILRSGPGEAGMIVVEVADSGPGFAGDRAAHLFDAFYSTKPEGMGMGLSICRTIIEAHDGRISATGAAGQGATFGFILPVADEASHRQPV
jgi:PAS domain S-box-containing protein